ncbi:MotA/TolQ/ExbB proton channel family protein [Enterovibrio sp. ZSDZ35]|uniref:MotA/TolQ/ExbB proton channel family protein n=1 Tax=Enterovibrio qingdaonensis TaxID=2899818 RepID=A0ABT5QJ63_9GAMM|nr:MotA/TolQ/ExbB proton channel family protein [Enterovibrio sp. ZSDZ35]MDD1781027.1 MotA/TolQ/ExbB proton channel family protein [Enterovibrio sp. ZSDZ35]
MKGLQIAPLLLVTSLFSPLAISDDLTKETLRAQQVAQQHNVVRESGFVADEQALQAKLDALKAQQQRLETETTTLSETFTDNEQKLSALEENLRLETGSLGEVFGVVRQATKELSLARENRPATIDDAALNDAIEKIENAKALPSLATLTSLWTGIENELAKSGEIAEITVNTRNAQGVLSETPAVRLGNIALVNEAGYLAWHSANQQATQFSTMPEDGVNLATIEKAKVGDFVLFDPTFGVLLDQLSLTPTLKDRFEQGGIVGKVITAILIIGLGIALVRGLILVKTRISMSNQMKRPEQPGENPLGRVLNVYHSEPDRTLDTLELRLMETILDEQQGFEKGLSMLKLLAALAPMLGLLGTVTGMIETFQVITQYGNGDPTVMAGGISMALVTTVMGLITAMPLLLAHNLLSTQADTMRGILEKVGVSLVAEQSEKADSVKVRKSVA